LEKVSHCSCFWPQQQLYTGGNGNSFNNQQWGLESAVTASHCSGSGLDKSCQPAVMANFQHSAVEAKSAAGMAQ